MDVRRLRVGEWAVGAAGLVLLVALFLPWYRGEEGTPPPAGWSAYAPLEDGARTLTGWQALGALDVVLALLALAAVAVPVVTAAYRVPAVPLAHQTLVALAAPLVTLAVLVRVLNLPDWATGREIGLWTGLVATLGVTAGALIAMRDERRSPAGRHTDLTGVPVSQPRPIEAVPAPRPGPDA